MSSPFRFEGVIRNVRYETQLHPTSLSTYPIDTFDINIAAPSGIVDMDKLGSTLGYSKWVSPKRTRSYPFARIYDTYHLPKVVTIIPIIKDEGAAGDNDRINFITFSWMNLMNVYIILAWYETARPHPRLPGKITGQLMNAAYIREKLIEISHYRQTALHWNMMHFSRDFEVIYGQAVQSYQNITAKTGIPTHTPHSHANVLETFKQNGVFDLETFKQASLPASYAASQREIATRHRLEALGEGEKGYFAITNWIGGQYHLTTDEIYYEDDVLVIQECKNASRHRLPKLPDIKDGLFKLILFTNMDELSLGGQKLPFRTQLKLTGQVEGELQLPNTLENVQAFIQANRLKPAEAKLLAALYDESNRNPKLNIWITGNT